MKTRLVMYGLTLSVVAACTTASVRVMPGEGDLHSVISRDIEREGAEEAAIEAAHDYCAKSQRTAVFVKDETKYTGQMDEGARNVIRNASAAAWMLSKTGSPISDAGQVGNAMTSDRDYKSEIQFKCR